MAIAYVKDTGKTRTGSGASLAASFGSLPSAGNAIATLVGGWNGSNNLDFTSGACTDNQGVGNTHTRAFQSSDDAGHRSAIFCASGIGATSGTFTVTVDPSGANGPIVMISIEYSGMLASSPLDKTATDAQPNGGTGTTIVTGTTATTAEADELLLAVASTGNGDNVAWTENGSWTQRLEETDNNGFQAVHGVERIVTATGAYSHQWTADGDILDNRAYAAGIATYKTAPAVTYEQEGFRFFNDDGDEDASTGNAAQDANITHPLDTNIRPRILVDTEGGDPASTQFRLDYKKSTDSVYIAVPLIQKVTPVIEAADATVTTIGTAADPWSINVPNASTGDLLIFVLAWDDSTDVTSVAAPAGQNSETISSIIGPQASASTEMRIQAWRTICTGAWTAGTISFNPSASETVRAVVMRVPAGEFDATTPIGASAGSSSAATNESNINSPAFSAGATDGDGRLVLCFSSDADAITVPASGTDTVDNATGGGVGLNVETRTAVVTNSESIASITATITSDSWAALAFVVRPNASPIYIAASSHIAAGGEATTNRLSAPGGGGSFTAGRIQDDENPADAVDLGTDGFTEVEWCVKASAPAANGHIYQFRVTRNGTDLDTYTVTPEWTIGTPGGGGATVKDMIGLGILPFARA